MGELTNKLDKDRYLFFSFQCCQVVCVLQIVEGPHNFHKACYGNDYASSRCSTRIQLTYITLVPNTPPEVAVVLQSNALNYTQKSVGNTIINSIESVGNTIVNCFSTNLYILLDLTFSNVIWFCCGPKHFIDIYSKHIFRS